MSVLLAAEGTDYFTKRQKMSSCLMHHALVSVGTMPTLKACTESYKIQMMCLSENQHVVLLHLSLLPFNLLALKGNVTYHTWFDLGKVG